MVLPAPGKPFEVFQTDDLNCRQWAQQQIGGASPSETANQNLATGAVIGTAVGAGLGVAIGAATGNAGAGAAIGGATGLLGGMGMASGPAYDSQWQLQSSTTWPISSATTPREIRFPVWRPASGEPTRHHHLRPATNKDQPVANQRRMRLRLLRRNTIRGRWRHSQARTRRHQGNGW